MIYPSDIDEANEAWGANCGPCSVAALLDRQVAAVKDLFPDFARRNYANITDIKKALTIAGAQHKTVGKQLPREGLVFIQWGGYENKPVFVQYRYTHWIAVTEGAVFEVNAPHLTTWESWQKIAPEMMQEAGIGNGTFSIRAGIEVSFGGR